ncbi:methyl-accepting chemotaxis protein [Beggiatoa alba]|nr:methyl-accepting chemotaxis protein [Beggiatoa alba]
MKKNFPISGVENDYPRELHIVSTTDLKGITTSVNEDFKTIAGFPYEELIGKSHNVVRHPDMPPVVFEDLWASLKEGKPWMGIVKNRCKNGDHYWVDAYVTPIRENGQVTGYQSVRTKPSQAHVDSADKLYQLINEGIPFLQQQRDKLRVGLMGKIYFGFLCALLPPMAILALLPVSKLTALLLASAAIMMGGVVAAKMVARPWQQAAKTSREIFSNDVAQQVYTGHTDELGQIQLVIKALQAQLNTVVWRIDAAVGELDSIATGTAASVTQTNQGIYEQQSEIEQVATAMNEMSATVQEVARNTAEAAEATRDAEGTAKEGALAAVESICGIDELASEMEQAAEVIRSLEQESNSVGTVLEVIRSIAEQTNLLALNAAIEAARAGEAGRGFAVVADEVRTLASRTQEATQEIDSMISRLQTKAKEAVQVMQKAQSGAQSNAEKVETLAESLAGISGAVRSINDMNAQIATAAEEQSAVSDEINRNIVNINTLAEQTTSVSEETAQAMQRLVTETGHLRAVVQQFGIN